MIKSSGFFFHRLIIRIFKKSVGGVYSLSHFRSTDGKGIDKGEGLRFFPRLANGMREITGTVHCVNHVQLTAGVLSSGRKTLRELGGMESVEERGREVEGPGWSTCSVSHSQNSGQHGPVQILGIYSSLSFLPSPVEPVSTRTLTALQT